MSSKESVHFLLSVGFFGILVGLTCSIFDEISDVQDTPYLDEIFHIPQAINFCNGRFRQWDPKITTLPGLYLLSVGVMGPINYLLGYAGNACQLYYLRMINLVTAFINFALLYDIRKRLRHFDGMFSLESFLIAVNLGTFPVLYFFSFLYYTDTLSTCLVLLMYDLHVAKCRNISAFVGVMAVLVRQTNIVWVIFMVLDALPEVISRQINLKKGKYLKSNERQLGYFKILGKCLQKVWRGGMDHIISFINNCFEDFGCYIAIGVGFAVFLFYNKGIVVGDKLAHQPVFHAMQLLYFAGFVTVFSCPFFIAELPRFLSCICKKKTISLFVTMLLLTLVHFNTIAHPYLLADNRHYVFYVWNRIYQKHFLYPYLLVPFYMFGAFGMSRLLRETKIVFQVNLLICVALCLVPQKLLEFRYFIIPYLLFHLNVNIKTCVPVILQLNLFCLINGYTIYIFLSKTFYWSNSQEEQRIMW